MFKHLFFPSVSRHVLVQGSNESYTKTCLDTEGKKKCLNILYLGTEGVVTNMQCHAKFYLLGCRPATYHVITTLFLISLIT